MAKLLEAEQLESKFTRAFVFDAFRDVQIRETGTERTRILPVVSRFGRDGQSGDARE